MRQTINILDTGLFTCLLLGHYTKKPERTKAGVAKLSQHPLSVFLSFFFFLQIVGLEKVLQQPQSIFEVQSGCCGRLTPPACQNLKFQSFYGRKNKPTTWVLFDT